MSSFPLPFPFPVPSFPLPFLFPPSPVMIFVVFNFSRIAKRGSSPCSLPGYAQDKLALYLSTDAF